MSHQQSHSSSFSYGFTYDVFLSFRGTDTRFRFIGHLYKALCDSGIRTFIDDRELHGGEEITPSLFKAIQESMIAIPVFSVNYATSSFCLDELVHIVDCFKKKLGHLILPIFYEVVPCHVRHQTGSYGEALAKHEKRFQNNNEKYIENMERLTNWKTALNESANFSGHHFSLGNAYESELIGKIVKEVSRKISRTPLHVADYPVGLQSRLLQVSSLMNIGYDDGVYMLGIYGIGGIGKSTLARAIYNLIADQFEALCFLHEVRENAAKYGLENLQKELLFKTIELKVKLGHSSEGIPIIKARLQQKKVLLILDDVDELKQLQVIVGKPDWFGHGSRIIVTTRDKHVLASHGIKRTYEVKPLNEEDAFEMFRWIAFKNNEVESSYFDILNRAVKYASGLPLALEVIGSNLFGKCIAEWESLLDEYERIPDKKIQKILQVSFDSLDEEKQNIFLDVACFFKGCALEEIEYILHAHYGYIIKHHVRVLVDKSLIKITSINSDFSNDVTVHDLIEDMGKEIVRQESRKSRKEPGERTRLWFHKDIVHVLKENTGTSKIEMIYLNCPSTEAVIDWNGKAFKKMKNLKTIIIKSGHFSKGSQHFPSSLRVLEWQKYPSVPSSLWNKKFENMKILNFDNCEYLTEIPDVSGLSSLEDFSFKGCENLITIHSSIGFLNKLEFLNARGCIKLLSFPPLKLTSLRQLVLLDCKSLQSFPEILDKMENITDIDIHGTSIESLPDSFQNLSELIDIAIYGRGMFKFPSIILNMPKLSHVAVQGYSKLLTKQIGSLCSTWPSNVETLHLNGRFNGDNLNLSYEFLSIALTCFSNVRRLDLSMSNFKVLPKCIKECRSLLSLRLDYCEYLEEISGTPPSLERLSALRCGSLNSASRNMLLNLKLHEVGKTCFCFPSPGSDRIPEWFEHRSRGLTISFWFRNKIPSIALLYSTKWRHNSRCDDQWSNIQLAVIVMINGQKFTLDWKVHDDHTYLLEMNLIEKSASTLEGISELYEAISKNKWIPVEVKFVSFFDDGNYEYDIDEWEGYKDYNYDYKRYEDDLRKSLNTSMGIHVLKDKNNMEDIKFSNPYRKRKSDEDLNTSLSKLDKPRPPITKFYTRRQRRPRSAGSRDANQGE